MNKESTRFFKLDLLGELDNPDLVFIHSFLEGLEAERWKTATGNPLSSLYTDDARIILESPKRIRRGVPAKTPTKLPSVLGNTLCLFIADHEVREAVEMYSNGSNIELLPFTLYSHRKKLLSTDYCIINPVGSIDCLDLKASRITWSKQVEGKILSVWEHVLDWRKVEHAPQLFRVLQNEQTYIIRMDLARELQKRKISNLIVRELSLTQLLSTI